jgi:hypothetical protein
MTRRPGAPTSITGPGGQRIAFTFDGPLPTAQIASGPISGSVERRYDDDLRLRETTVNGASAVDYEYDTDGLLTRAGRSWRRTRSHNLRRCQRETLVSDTSWRRRPGATTLQPETPRNRSFLRTQPRVRLSVTRDACLHETASPSAQPRRSCGTNENE